jgi:hypothetical protein
MLKFKSKFILYSENIECIREYEKVDDKYIKLEEPIKSKALGIYRHSFGCSLTDAMKKWNSIKQILFFERFYHLVGSKYEFNQGTKFNILLLPIVYLYSLIDTKKFHKVAFFSFLI